MSKNNHCKPAMKLKAGDLITNVWDVNPTFIGQVLSVYHRHDKEVSVKVLSAPTSPGQAMMPDEWTMNYFQAINMFRKLTEAEQLLYTKL